MRATITVSGKQGAGKTTWLDQIERALMTTGPAETIEVDLREATRPPNAFGSLHDEFTIPAVDAKAGTLGSGGNRETWSIQPEGMKNNAVYRGSKRIAVFIEPEDAGLFLRLKTALRGDSFYFDGARLLHSGGYVPAPDLPAPTEEATSLPPAVYWDDAAGNFYSNILGRLDCDFYKRWANRRSEFPQSEEEARRKWVKAWERPSAAEAPAIHDCFDCENSGVLDVLVSSAGRVLPPAEKSDGRKVGAALNEVLCERDQEREDYDFALGQLQNAWDILEVAAERFDAYAEQHFVKGTAESTKKALVNLRMARMCRAPIAPLPDPEKIAEAAA